MHLICKTIPDMLVRNKSIHLYTAIEKFSLSQDTITSSPEIQLANDSVPVKDSLIQKETTPFNTIRQFNLSEIDSILRRSEERERQIEIERQQQLAVKRPIYIRKIDTTEILYKQFGIAGFPLKEKLDNDPFQQNFLYNFNCIKPKQKKVNEDVFIETQISERSQLKTETKVSANEIIRPEYIKGRIQFDWVTILLSVSLLLLGWVRLFNKKYLISLFKSIVSYKESNNLLREKNSLMERASFLINLFFISNVSIFTIQLKQFFGIAINNFEDYIIYLIAFASLLGLYIFRAFSSGLIGFVFLKQKVFLEYFHNVNIFTKNTGIVLLPVIIALQFLAYDYLKIIIYLGIAFIGLLYFFQLLRAFQIIIRKNASIFYMILYLCAFEFAPFLIIYKLLISLGQ